MFKELKSYYHIEDLDTENEHVVGDIPTQHSSRGSSAGRYVAPPSLHCPGDSDDVFQPEGSRPSSPRWRGRTT